MLYNTPSYIMLITQPDICNLEECFSLELRQCQTKANSTNDKIKPNLIEKADLLSIY